MSQDKRLNEVIRVQKRPSGFVLMDKGFLENPELSFKAKGILAYLLGKPDNWKVIVGDLVKHAKEGKTAVYNGLMELKEHGHYEKVPVRDEKGIIDHWESTVYELPKAVNPQNKPSHPLPGFPEMDKPKMDNPDMGNPDMANPPRLNNDFNKKEINNKERTKIQSSQVLSATPPDGRDKDGADPYKMFGSPARNTPSVYATPTTEQTIKTYTEIIKENIGYNDLIISRRFDMGLIDEFIAIIIDTIMTEGKAVRIGGEDKPRALVKSVLLKLTYEDIELVLDQFKSITGRISKKKQYILTMLYNSRLENYAHYTNAVKADMWQ